MERRTSGIRKLNAEGKPGSEKDVIMPVIVHNGLIYVAGQGAHDSRDQKEWTIESHTKIVMDKVQKMVEVGGGTMDTDPASERVPRKDRALGWNAQGVRDLLPAWRTVTDNSGGSGSPG